MTSTLQVAEDGIESSDFELGPLMGERPQNKIGSYGKIVLVSLGAVAIVVMAVGSTGGNYPQLKAVDDLDGFMQADEECDEELIGSNDEGYRGCQNVARNGKICQGWYTLVPHPHHYLPGVYAHKGIGIHNYCRNPSGSQTIWCYVTTVGFMGKRWEYCDPLSAGETSAPTPAPTTTATEPPPPTPAPEPDEMTTTTTTTLNEEEKEEEEQADEDDAIDDGGTVVPPGSQPTTCFEKRIICRDERNGPARWPFCGFRLTADPETCQQECQDKAECKFFSWHHHLCYLRTFKGSMCFQVSGEMWDDYTTGPKNCPDSLSK